MTDRDGNIALSSDAFVKVPYALFEDARLNNNDRAVFIALLAHRNRKTGLCCPSIEAIAEDTDLTTATVKRSRNKLKRLRFINWKHERRSHSMHEHCAYSLNHWYVASEKKKRPAPEVPRQDTEPASMFYEGKRFTITDDQATMLCDQFNLDRGHFTRELAKMEGWLADKDHVKVTDGFIENWLERSKIIPPKHNKDTSIKEMLEGVREARRTASDSKLAEINRWKKEKEERLAREEAERLKSSIGH